MESHYKFNVVWNGKHLFATAPGSFPSCMPESAKSFYSLLCERFPEKEGFSVSVYKWECIGHEVTLDFIKEGY